MAGITGLTNTAANSITNTFAKKSGEAADSTQVISSGTRLTRASVDASSLAISEKLRSNIEVLTQANRNAAQGASVVQLAVGAQQNILSLLTSMNTLTTKSNNGSEDSKSRALIDTEFQKLLNQVDKIASQVRWNGAALLNGGSGTVSVAGATTLAAAGYATATTNTLAAAPINLTNSKGFISGKFTDADVVLNNGVYDITLTMKNSTPGGEVTQVFKGSMAGGTAVNASKVALKSESDAGNTLVLEFAADASGVTTAATFESALKTVLNIGVGLNGANIVSTATAVNNGIAANGSITVASNTPAGTYALSYDSVTKLMTLSTGGESDKVLMTAAGAQSVQFANGVSVALDSSFALGTAITQIVFDVAVSTSAVSMNLQVAEKASDTISVDIAGSSASALGLSGLDVKDQTNAVTAGDALAKALQTINDSIAKLGAQQKQLEYASNNLKTTIENNVAARGVYNDADIPSEMTKLTQATVFTQLSQAMLSQSLDMQRKLVDLTR
ncbi:MAG: hypothetical protein KBB83_03425 [Alphaproteobacteria bacterium]|nr:hypothetical protein [Alphaproteobacteria bacterium]